ncbi:uncharacterized protein [Lepeophtheirus salmonis]|nr:uncharacterized protein LOC121116323 [Lepeophtheirus salmonis]
MKISIFVILLFCSSIAVSKKTLNKAFEGNWVEDISKRGNVRKIFKSFNLSDTFIKKVADSKVAAKVHIKLNDDSVKTETVYGSESFKDTLEIKLNDKEKEKQHHDFHMFGGEKLFDYGIGKKHFIINIYNKDDKNKAIATIKRELVSDKVMKMTLQNKKDNTKLSSIFKKDKKNT